MDNIYFHKKMNLTTIVTLRIFNVLFRSNSLSELNVIFIYFSSHWSDFLVIDLIKSMILIYSSSYFLNFYLLSLVGTSVKNLFPLFSSISIASLFLKIRCKGFTLLIFTYFKPLIFTYLMTLLLVFDLFC